jgi:hypothetical protein
MSLRSGFSILLEIECPEMITVISTGYNILTMKLTENILLQVNLSLKSRGFFPYCALNIRCAITGDFVSASHRKHLACSCTGAIFKENQQQRSWWQEQYTEDTSMVTL